MSHFLPWFLTVVLACVSAAECGSLQLAGRHQEALARERDALIVSVDALQQERRTQIRRTECVIRPDICLGNGQP